MPPSKEELEKILALTPDKLSKLPSDNLQETLDRLRMYADMPEQASRNVVARLAKEMQNEISGKIRQILSLLPETEKKEEENSGKKPKQKKRVLGVRRPSDIERVTQTHFLQLLGEEGYSQILEQCLERGFSQEEMTMNYNIPSFFHGMTMVRVVEVSKRQGSGACVIACAIHIVAPEGRKPLLLNVVVQKKQAPNRGKSPQSVENNMCVEIRIIDAHDTDQRDTWKIDPVPGLKDYTETVAAGRLWGDTSPSDVYAFTPFQIEQRLNAARDNRNVDAGMNERDEYECLKRLAAMRGNRFKAVLQSIPWKEELEKMVQSGDFAFLVNATQNGANVVGSSLKKVDQSVQNISVPFSGRSTKN